MQPDRIPIAYRAPFDFGRCYVDERPPGESILDIVLSVPNLPRNFFDDGYVCLNGEIIPRAMWRHVRPKPTRRELPIAITLHVALHGGGGGGGRSTTKSIIGIVAAIALVVITYGIASGAIFPALAATEIGFGITAANVVAGAVGIAGALAISALTAPPTTAGPEAATGDSNTDNKDPAAASGNVIDRGGAVPRVIGTRKIFPPLVCQPVVELIDQDEYVEALFVLNGPHAISNIRIEGNAIDEAEDVEFETREGWSTDTDISLVTRQGRTTAPQLELSSTSMASDNLHLAHQALPESDLPVWHGVSSRPSPDEIWLHLLFPGGISDGAGGLIMIPLRIRFRLRGTSTWINVPEVQIGQLSVNQFRAAILFKWESAPTMPDPPGLGFMNAYLNVPPQFAAPPTPVDREWNSNSYFDDGAGNNYLFIGNAASTRIRNIALYDNRLEIFLDEGTFPKGIYEIEVKRGMPFNLALFNRFTYAYTTPLGQWDWFWYRQVFVGNLQIPQSVNNYSHRVLLTRVISIWHDTPVKETGFAQIAIKAINRSVNQLSCTASGYVRDWDGSGWNAWTTTSNPAPHYADVLSGELNLDPLPTDLRDDTALVAWRQLCIDNDWTCDSIINDMRTQDVLSLLASCGYARPYQSDVYGIIVDNDRTADDPVQIFSRRNCANLRYERSFARVPAGFNVTYRDETEDDDQAQVTVYQRDPANSDLTLLESITYDGLIDVAKVTKRAQFDLDQVNLRSTFYYLDADIESIVCRRGSLIGVEHDILSNRAGDGYIVSKQTSGGNITGVTLDADIPITTGIDMHATTDMHAVTDLHDLGVTTGIVIRHTDGTLSTHALSNPDGNDNVLTFATPIADDATIQGYENNDRKYGCLVVAGELETIYRRLLVQSIQPQRDLTATMVLVDEAPELVR